MKLRSKTENGKVPVIGIEVKFNYSFWDYYQKKTIISKHQSVIGIIAYQKKTGLFAEPG